MILKQRFTLSLEDILFEKPQGGQIDPPAVLGLNERGGNAGPYPGIFWGHRFLKW